MSRKSHEEREGRTEGDGSQDNHGRCSPQPQSPDPRSDQHLLDAARKGDLKALSALHQRYHPLCLRLAYRWTGSTDGAEDLVQDAFKDLLEGLPRLRIRGRFRNYFCTVIRNKSATWCRTRQRERERERAPTPRSRLLHCSKTALPGRSICFWTCCLPSNARF